MSTSTVTYQKVNLLNKQVTEVTKKLTEYNERKDITS
jgi:hypothetical protein